MSRVATRIFDFTLQLAGIQELTVELGEALFLAGCDDASPWSEGPIVHLTFHRDAESLGDAVGSAIKCVQKAGVEVARVAIEETKDLDD